MAGFSWTNAGNRPSRKRPPILVSFSGIDGTGKSTQIEALKTWLNDAGFRSHVFKFWDDVAVLGRVRETMGHALFKGEKGIGSPDNPVRRRDKNVQSWYMTAVRLYLYALDALALFIKVLRVSRASDADIVIFDRYLYDELANLNLEDRVTRAYVQELVRVIPRPDAAYLLDADPLLARERKPEYPLEFLHRNRAAYLALSGLIEGMTVVAPGTQEEVTHTVLQQMAKALSASRCECTADCLTST